MSITTIFKLHENEETITVAGLIAALQGMPLNARIRTEGCDCTGNAIALDYSEKYNEVLICREIPFDIPSKPKFITEKIDEDVENIELIEATPKNLADLDE